MLTAKQRRISSAIQVGKELLDNILRLARSTRINYFDRFKPTSKSKKAAIVLTIDSSPNSDYASPYTTKSIKINTSDAKPASSVTYYAEQFTPENLDEQSATQYRLVSNIQLFPQTPTKGANCPDVLIKAETPGGTVMVSSRSAELTYSETDDTDATPSDQRNSVSRQIFFLSPEASVPDQQSESLALHDEDSQMLNDQFAARALFDEFDSDEPAEVQSLPAKHSSIKHRNSKSPSITPLPITTKDSESTLACNPFAEPVVFRKSARVELTKKDLEARAQIPRSSLPSQRTVMGGISATEHFNSRCKRTKESSTANSSAPKSSLYSPHSYRKEWLHLLGVSLSKKDTNPQVKENLGCGYAWINTGMMVPERIVYFLANNSLNSTTPMNISYHPQMFITAANIISNVTCSLTAHVEVDTAKSVKSKSGKCAHNRTIERSVIVTFKEMHATSTPNLASSTDITQTVFAIVGLLSATKPSHTEVIHTATKPVLFSPLKTTTQITTEDDNSCSRSSGKLRDITNLPRQEEPLTSVKEPVKSVHQKRHR